MSSDAILCSEEASAGFVIPPSARSCVHDARRQSRSFWGEFRHICSLAVGGREDYVAYMKNIAKCDNYNAIHVNRSDTLTKWLGPILTHLTTVGVMSYRIEPACSPRAHVGISDNFVKIGMNRFSAN